MIKMTKKQLAAEAIKRLKAEYPEVKCALVYEKPHELLIATRLSAQCTDKRVNLVTPVLFRRFPTINAFADADIAEIENLIKSCGLFHTKAHDIIEMCRQLRDIYGGIIPDTVDELVKLAGVGRKTANLVVGDLYGKPAIVCDTHVIRLSNRLGLAHGKNPSQIETQLRSIIPPQESLNFCHRLVSHGRLICSARSPQCRACSLHDICAASL